MFWKLRRKVARYSFDKAVGDILKTPPVPLVKAPLTIVSMIKKTDTIMYLLSMKAFYRRIGRGQLLAIVDRDMPREDLLLIEQHFPGIAFQILEDIDTGPCQRGGTWERILFILDLARDRYVVQVDCDTLPVTADLSEVVDCIETGTAFTLTDHNRQILPLRAAAEAARQVDSDFVGIVAERQFDQYPDADRLRYVRASSGLAGFAPGGFPRERMEEFHRVMEGMVGVARWREWGTEQCASNFAVANSPKAMVLPHPAYTSFGPGVPRQGVKFYHFIGTYRFDDGFFAAKGREEIAAILQEARMPA